MMMLNPNGLYLHNLSTGSVFFGVLLQWFGLALLIWVIIAFFARLMLRSAARRTMATFKFGQGRAKWN